MKTISIRLEDSIYEELGEMLDARGAISVSERAAFIGRVRKLARLCAQCYLKQREELGYPMMGKGNKA